MVRFQKLTRNLFLTLLGHNVSSCNCLSFSCATSSSLLMLTAGPRGQFPRWRRSRKMLSVCSVLRCPDLWLQCSVSFVHCNHRSGHLKTEHTESLFLLRLHLGNWPRGPAVSMRSELLVAHEKLGQLPLLTSCPSKVRNKFLVNFWNRTVLLCIPCIILTEPPIVNLIKKCTINIYTLDLFSIRPVDDSIQSKRVALNVII